MSRVVSSRFTLPLAAASLALPLIGCDLVDQTSQASTVVEPEVVEGNPHCADIGHPDAYEVKFDPPESGTITGEAGVSITMETDGVYFDFSATSCIAAAIGKGGPMANVYQYDPAVTADYGLSAPLNANSGELYDLSHATFCYYPPETCPSDDGCTRTRGYWQTHSEYGPAPYDDTWAQLEDGADTDFFLSGQSYYEVLHTAPRGNAYYILAAQYIAAELNQLAGADASAIADAFAAATGILEANTPDDIAGADDELRAEVVALAGTLDAYNNGEIGPGHCDGAGDDDGDDDDDDDDDDIIIK
jgi:hypothetical protein